MQTNKPVNHKLMIIQSFLLAYICNSRLTRLVLQRIKPQSESQNYNRIPKQEDRYYQVKPADKE